MPAPRKSWVDAWRTAGEVGSVGLSFVIAVLIGVWVGRTLDAWMGTAPWMLRLFFAFGVAAGALNVYRTLKRFLK